MCYCVYFICMFCEAITTALWAAAGFMCEHRSCLVLQGSHAFFQMELQSFIGLSEQTIHGVWQTLVVLLIHFLSLTSLMSREREPDGEAHVIIKFSLWHRLYLGAFTELIKHLCMDLMMKCVFNPRSPVARYRYSWPTMDLTARVI